MLIITVEDEWASLPRKEAYKWLSQMIRKIIKKDNAMWEGELRTVQPLGFGIAGCQYKAILHDVPEDSIDKTIMPGLKDEGCLVKKAGSPAVVQQRKNAKKKVGGRQASYRRSRGLGGIAGYDPNFGLNAWRGRPRGQTTKILTGGDDGFKNVCHSGKCEFGGNTNQ